MLHPAPLLEPLSPVLPSALWCPEVPQQGSGRSQAWPEDPSQSCPQSPSSPVFCVCPRPGPLPHQPVPSSVGGRLATGSCWLWDGHRGLPALTSPVIGAGCVSWPRAGRRLHCLQICPADLVVRVAAGAATGLSLATGGPREAGRCPPLLRRGLYLTRALHCSSGSVPLCSSRRCRGLLGTGMGPPRPVGPVGWVPEQP